MSLASHISRLRRARCLPVFRGHTETPQLGGGTGPNIANANRSVVSLICSSEVGGLVVIGVDCALVTPNVLGGTGISAPAAAVAADGAVTTGDPG